MTDERYAYSVTLTRDEYRALEWLEDHGYAGDMIEHASTVDECGDTVILRYRESAAWNVLSEMEDDVHAFGACAGPALLRKMLALVESIV